VATDESGVARHIAPSADAVPARLDLQQLFLNDFHLPGDIARQRGAVAPGHIGAGHDALAVGGDHALLEPGIGGVLA